MACTDLDSFFVFGMARSGRAVAALLAERGCSVTVYDENPRALAAAAEVAALGDIAVADTASWRGSLEACSCLVISPGIPLDHIVVACARDRAIPVVGEVEVAFHYSEARIVAVTGTNGKSTVVGVIGEILRHAGLNVDVAGNIGRPFAESVRESQCAVVVLELSSFQLDTIDEFRADVAVILNIRPDHLDRYHKSFEEYRASKARILENAGPDTVFVYNAEDEASSALAETHAGPVVPFSSARVLPAGVFERQGMIVRRVGEREDEIVRRSEFTPVGVHNLENALAAVAASAVFDVPLDRMRGALRSYNPLPHRMELVGVIGGISYVNDSKATNVDAAIMSLRSVENGVVVILGGRDKDGDFSALIPHLSRVRLAVLIGEAAGAIRTALGGHCDMVDAPDMAGAVRAATDAAEPGDTVLLAPACASFDMFDSYEARGASFREAVNAL
jgi:UDP-N-acetylmuramoylalanine--D-glutamate ligase